MTIDIQQSRIEPVLDEKGKPIDLVPPAGGRWLRAADGGLEPADESTAQGAGLSWPPASATPAPAPVARTVNRSE